jgi:hypothetical protein
MRVAKGTQLQQKHRLPSYLCTRVRVSSYVGLAIARHALMVLLRHEQRLELRLLYFSFVSRPRLQLA